MAYSDPDGRLRGGELADSIDAQIDKFKAIAVSSYTDGSAMGVALTTPSGTALIDYRLVLTFFG